MIRRLPILLAVVILVAIARPAVGADRTPQATVIAAVGRVEFLSDHGDTWYAAGSNLVLYAGDQLRTGERSRAVLRLRDQSIVPVGALSALRLQDRPQSVLLQLLHGVISFFHRDEPGSLGFEGGGINAAVRGTEVAFALRENGALQITLFDGVVDVSATNAHTLTLSSGDVLEFGPDQPAPRIAGNVRLGDWSAVQWALYYPTILDPADLGWTDAPSTVPHDAWTAYVQGDVVAALAAYPATRNPSTPEEHEFYAALLLAVGAVEPAEIQLAQVPADSPVRKLAIAHLRLIDAIRRGPRSASPSENPPPRRPPRNWRNLTWPSSREV